MSTFLVALGICCLAAIGMEVLLWRMCRARLAGLLFPRSADFSSLHFFSLGRLRALALLHLAFCLGILVLTYSLLW